MSRSVEYHITQYELEQGALEIQYIEEYFGEFPRKKTAAEIMNRLEGRSHLILCAAARTPGCRVARGPSWRVRSGWRTTTPWRGAWTWPRCFSSASPGCATTS